jgi:N-acetylmuramoyl-L-alanine amidase
VVSRARLLFMQAGFKVVLTRSSDTFISLPDRVRIANAQKNALFISVHFNAGGAGTGLETYTLAPRGVPSRAADGPSITDLTPCAGHQNDAENMALATATHAAMVVRSRMWDRGIKRARFVVIRDIAIPGVLVEGGFLTNVNDAKVVATPQYRQQMAGAILQAVQNYRRAVGTQAGVVAVQRVGPEPPPPPVTEPPADSTTEEGPRVITPTAAEPGKRE